MTTKNENPTNGSNDGQTDDVKVVGTSGAGVIRDTPAEEVREAVNAPVEGYNLTALKEEEVVTPGLVTLEVVADGTFSSSTGEVLRTGDRKLVSSADAAALLDVKVNGKTAFKAV